ncbi:MAG: tetratricopeptide repeat protein [bacterium]
MKSVNQKTIILRINGIITFAAALLVLLCTDVTQQALGMNLPVGLVVAVDSKGKSGTKNQKGRGGAKGEQGKKKSKPGGSQAKAVPAWEQDSVPLEQRIRLARSYASAKDYAKAEQQLRLVLARDPRNFAAHNSLGNVYFLQGNLDSAEVNYFKALPRAATANDSLGIRLNLGALFYVADSQAVAEEIISEVLKDSSDLDRVELVLGLNFENINATPASPGGVRRLSPGAMKSLIFSVLASKQKRSDMPDKQRIHSSDPPKTAASAPPVPTAREGSKVGVKKPRTRPGGSKGWRPPDLIEDVFFWAASSESKAVRPMY